MIQSHSISTGKPRKVRGYRIRGYHKNWTPFDMGVQFLATVPLETWQAVTSNPDVISAYLYESGRKIEQYHTF